MQTMQCTSNGLIVQDRSQHWCADVWFVSELNARLLDLLLSVAYISVGGR